MLKPQLFTVYIHDLDTGTKARFADYPKLDERLNCEEDRKWLEKDFE